MTRILSLASLMLFAAVSLSACHAHPRHPHDGDFCPPGQHKKGNC